MAPRLAAVTALPSAPGVYRFRDGRDRVIYLGRATDLRHRVASYWGDLTDRAHLRRMIPQVARIEAVQCDCAHEAAWLERNLLERSKPRWNRMRGGAETPVWIALVRRAGRARLAVVHSPDQARGAATFGPYLGGGQGRLAAAGVERALALAYAGRPRGGFDRDMARLREVGAADLDDVVTRTLAVLGRDPWAVAALTQDLARRRDAAAGAQAYELAARIQHEIDAVRWITSPQKVTAPGEPDATVTAWCDGIRVTFEIQHGRLNRWLQTYDDHCREREQTVAPDDTWRVFVDRAAALAADLRRTG